MIIGQFLVLKKIEDLFRESLKDTCGASAKQAPYFYCRNYQVVPWFYIPRIMLILHGPFFLDILASISSLFQHSVSLEVSSVSTTNFTG